MLIAGSVNRHGCQSALASSTGDGGTQCCDPTFGLEAGWSGAKRKNLVGLGQAVDWVYGFCKKMKVKMFLFRSQSSARF